ncbi:Uncharacterised protein [Serratia proteamaculans]|nr:Uncharacterised protein [Serratia proteamaculans]CAI1059814.1 Uncharacterised protein [Serratia proteamaculans]
MVKGVEQNTFGRKLMSIYNKKEIISIHSTVYIFRQPALHYFPCFIQYSEQIKIQYFGPVRSVKPLDKGIFRWFAWLNKF